MGVRLDDVDAGDDVRLGDIRHGRRRYRAPTTATKVSAHNARLRDTVTIETGWADVSPKQPHGTRSPRTRCRAMATVNAPRSTSAAAAVQTPPIWATSSAPSTSSTHGRTGISQPGVPNARAVAGQAGWRSLAVPDTSSTAPTAMRQRTTITP